MKRKMTKTYLLLVISLLINLVVYSNGNKDTGGIVQGDGDPLGKYSPAIEVHVVKEADQSQKFITGNPDVESYEVNMINQMVEDKLGIKLIYDWVVPTEQFNTKYNLTIASGTLPDLMPMKILQFQELSKADVLQDMNPYIDEYASPTLKMLYEWDEGFTRDAVTIEGKLLSVPITGTSPDNSPILWIRKDWLDKVGLDVPTTMDEVVNVARAFTKEDPDGNGKDDTYGLAMNKTLGGGLSNINGFMNGYGAYFDIWIKKGNEIAYGSVQPEARVALQKLQEMYADGLIDPEFSVKDPVKAGEVVVSGKVGMLYGRTWACYVNIKENSLKDVNAEWLPYPAPGMNSSPAKVQASASLNGMSFLGVNKKFAHPEAAVKLVGLYATNYYGAKSADEWNENIHYPKGDGTWVSMIHLPAVEIRSPWNDYNQYIQLKEALKVNDRSILMPYVQVVWDMVTGYLADTSQRQNLPAYLQVGPIGSQSVIEQYRKQDMIVLDEFMGFKTPTMLEKESTLQAKVLEVYTRIIMGEPIEEFDAFVKDWQALGGEQITAEANEWYKLNK